MAKRTSSSLKCTAHRTVQHYSGWRQCGGSSIVAATTTVAAEVAPVATVEAAAPPSTVLESLQRPRRNKDLKARHCSKTQILKSWHIQFWANSILITFHLECISKRAFPKQIAFILNRAYLIWADSKRGTFHFDHSPKRVCSKKSTFHFDYLPKWAHFEHILFWYRSKKSTFQKEQLSLWSHSKKATPFWAHSK